MPEGNKAGGCSRYSTQVHLHHKKDALSNAPWPLGPALPPLFSTHLFASQFQTQLPHFASFSGCCRRQTRPREKAFGPLHWKPGLKFLTANAKKCNFDSGPSRPFLFCPTQIVKRKLPFVKTWNQLFATSYDSCLYPGLNFPTQIIKPTAAKLRSETKTMRVCFLRWPKGAEYWKNAKICL